MKHTTWAGGAKLTWQDVKRIRTRKGLTKAQIEDLAERYSVKAETIYRAFVGLSWKTVRYRKLPTEYKRCLMCRQRFERRFTNGRHRSDKFWAQKVTCTNSCHAKYNWLRGKYDNR